MKDTTMPETDSRRSARLADPSLRAALERFVRGRVPADDVDDIVQATLTDAVASSAVPTDPTELRRWVHGIARHKVADHYRDAARDRPRDSTSSLMDEAESAPLSARELLHWAERELPAGDDAKSTFEWMLREGDGEKLEHIAREHEIEAPRVRQRVSRLRRYLRERWAQQIAAVAAVFVLVVIGLLVWWQMPRGEAPIVRDEPRGEPSPEQRGGELRRRALEACRDSQWGRCLEGLDAAKRLDPAGDGSEQVRKAREDAARALAPVPSAVPSSAPEAPTAVPTTSSTVAPPSPKPVRTSLPVAPSTRRDKTGPSKADPSSWEDFGSK